MLTDTDLASHEHFLTSGQRHHPITLPSDPADDELARHWTLTDADIRQVLLCRGEQNRRSFALQLCLLRTYGRFLPEYTALPVRIINHLGRQLGLPPVLFVEPPHRQATDLEHERRIRDHLNFRQFNQFTQERLEHWIASRAASGLLPLDLYRRAEAVLLSWKVVLPGPSVLERLIVSIVACTRQAIFEQITARLSPQMCAAIDELLQVPPEDYRSNFFRLKAYPPEATAAAILLYIEHYQLLRTIGATRIDLAGVNPHLARHLSQLAKQYKAQALRRFPAAKRYAMMCCFLVEAQKTVLDQIVAMNDQLLMKKCREARHALEARRQELRRRAKGHLEMILISMETLLDPHLPREITLRDIYCHVDEAALREAVAECRALTRLEERGYVDELCGRYTYLRRYLPAFVELPFEAEPGGEELLEVLALLRQLNNGVICDVPQDAPSAFVPVAWQQALQREDGAYDRRIWELALCLEVRDALRRGDLFLAESRRHVSFSNLIYNDQQWIDERAGAYVEMSLPYQADQALERLRQEFESAAQQAEQGLAHNTFAMIRDGRLKLRRDDALETSDRVRELRRVIETNLPRVRIEDLLRKVESRCGFIRALQPLPGYKPQSPNLSVAKLAALIAHGTNLGVVAMGHSAEEVTTEMLQHVTKWFLREETLKAANALLVNEHARLELSSVYGPGIASSSDGQRFAVQGSSLLASLYPRYFGYYERAITIYTHVSDQFSVFSTQAISCAPREALYVLDGLLENNTILRPREHHVDTHGYTEHLFGLCFLLGFSFMPRIRDLADQHLYRIDQATSYGAIDALFRGRIDIELISEQWDQLVRVAASLRNRTAPAHVVVQRLAGSAPSNRLAKALTALGRMVKTIYILRYLQDEVLRRRVQRQLNRGESRHDLARWLFFANRGEFRTGDYEEIMNKASCLSLLSNAVVMWNMIEIGKIVQRLRDKGERVEDEDLVRVTPLLHAHVIPNGTYFFSRELSRQ